MSERADDYIYATAGSGNIDYADMYNSLIKNNEKKVINLQLRYWVTALTKFQPLYENYCPIDLALEIINLLGNSLTSLAGMNIEATGNKTPSLLRLFNEKLVTDRGWDLKEDNPELFEKLKELDKIHKDVTKHLSAHISKKEKIKEVNYVKLSEYMNTTKEIWMWVLHKKYGETIPDKQLRFFRENF